MRTNTRGITLLQLWERRGPDRRKREALVGGREKRVVRGSIRTTEKKRSLGGGEERGGKSALSFKRLVQPN